MYTTSLLWEVHTVISLEHRDLPALPQRRKNGIDRSMQDQKVLVIDDDAELIELLRRIFARTGAQVLGACDGREGLRQFSQHRPDLVVLDIMMPGMDGWEVCRSLRQSSDVPILILTAMAAPQQVIHALDGGADDYVTKPFDIHFLLARAQALLHRSAKAGGRRDADA
jgi:DNA-binding response OmpR family regulator